MGLMCWSPPLDKMGNSVKGIHFCHVSCIAFSAFWGCVWVLLGVFLCVFWFFPFAADAYGASVSIAEI